MEGHIYLTLKTEELGIDFSKCPDGGVGSSQDTELIRHWTEHVLDALRPVRGTNWPDKLHVSDNLGGTGNVVVKKDTTTIVLPLGLSMLDKMKFTVQKGFEGEHKVDHVKVTCRVFVDHNTAGDKIACGFWYDKSGRCSVIVTNNPANNGVSMRRLIEVVADNLVSANVLLLSVLAGDISMGRGQVLDFAHGFETKHTMRWLV